MSARLKLIVAYDGAPFAGWQSQAHGNTIQDHLERAFGVISGEKLRVHGAGRTDAGVHALAQCAHVDVAEKRLNASQWTAALNSRLPMQIRVIRCSYVSNSFHARFSATGKTYRYRIWSGAVLRPFEHLRCWHIPAALDGEAMMRAAKHFVGRHDFAPFAANRGKVEDETERTIESLRLRKRGALLTFETTGDGFLYKMVRLMVGALVRVGRGDVRSDEIRSALQGRRPAPRLVAPAAGLVLVRVRYT